MNSKTFVFTLIMLFSVAMMAQVIHVPGDQPNIQAGIDAAGNGDMVLVDQGTYYENINFKGKAIIVCSNYLNTMDSADIDNTIINGSQPSHPDSASVVYFISGEDNSSILLGFTITGGGGTPAQGGDRNGGGIFIKGAGPIIEHNIILGNACVGGGSYLSGGGIFVYNANDFSPYITHNIILGNSCSSSDPLNSAVTGGGISITDSDECIVDNNFIFENYIYQGAGKQAVGGGIEIFNSRGNITNNIICGNIVQNTGSNWNPWGGGIYGEDTRDGTIISGNLICNDTMIGNTNHKGGGIAIFKNLGQLIIDKNMLMLNSAKYGGGLSLAIFGEVQITNNVIIANEAMSEGGAFSFQGASKEKKSGRGEQYDPLNQGEDGINMKMTESPLLANNTIIENTSASYGGAILYNCNMPIIAFNNIFHDNQGLLNREILLANSSDGYFYNNNLDTSKIYGSGNWEAEDNMQETPEFIDDSCHLGELSPFIDAGLTSIELGGVLYYCPDHDIDNDLRPLNGAADIGSDERLIVGLDEWVHTDYGNIKVYPNPVRNNLYIQYTVFSMQYTILTIHDAIGKVVETLVDKKQAAGDYKVRFNAERLAAGVYFYRLRSGKQLTSGKMVKQ